jgi:NitT/TauT family transport system ATP-binding protein
MNRQILNCGYLPLVDSAPLIIAQALGFAQEEGIALNLLRQPSWAALRDLLALGHLDAAHMLAPMPVAMSLGLSGKQIATDALMMLSINGTVTGVSKAGANRMREQGWSGAFLDKSGTRDALLACCTGEAALRVGVPFPYSMHRFLFAHWMGAQIGAFEFVTMPPPLMAQAVADGEIDLFCVGEPWGTVAVETAVAELILPSVEIWNRAPEKVLAVRRDWGEQNARAAGALMRAIHRACAWLDNPDNHGLASGILARSEHLDLPDHAIDRALTGQILPALCRTPIEVPAFLRFHRGGATVPQREQADWIASAMAQSQSMDFADVLGAARASFRTDLYTAYIPDAALEISLAQTPFGAAHDGTIPSSGAFFGGATQDDLPKK